MLNNYISKNSLGNKRMLNIVFLKNGNASFFKVVYQVDALAKPIAHTHTHTHTHSHAHTHTHTHTLTHTHTHTLTHTLLQVCIRIKFFKRRAM